MINNVTIVGRLTRNPELNKTQTGTSVTNFTLAANRRFGNTEQADFINCVAWKHSAEFLYKYMRKGNLIGVVGRIQSRTYDDDTGRTIYVQEVVAEQVQALESKASRDNKQNNYNNYHQTTGNNQDNDFNQMIEDNDLDITSDDLPF